MEKSKYRNIEILHKMEKNQEKIRKLKKKSTKLKNGLKIENGKFVQNGKKN